MNDLRLIYIGTLLLLGVLLFQAWIEEKTPARDAQAPVETLSPVKPVAQESAPALPPDDIPDLPILPPESLQPASESLPDALGTKQFIMVTTDVLGLHIDLQGGTISRLDLTAYPQSLKQSEIPFRLLDDRPGRIYVLQSGLRAAEGLKAPTHRDVYRAEGKEFRLEGEELRVPLTWEDAEQQLKVTKTFIFKRGSYEITVEHKVENQSGRPWIGALYQQLQRTGHKVDNEWFMHTYTGAVYYDTLEKKYRRFDFSRMEKEALNLVQLGGWLAMVQHYFVSALIVPETEQAQFYSRVRNDGFDRLYLVGTLQNARTVPAQSGYTFVSSVYVGPKIAEKLNAAAPRLALSIDYGWITVIAQPLFWVLKLFHDLIPSWGLAIILLTILIKLAFAPLSHASYLSLGRMRQLQPRLEALKERYAEDRARLGQAMMDLYRTEKVNPLGGCLPVLIQIPVFIGLYWMLLEAVELRLTPFLWMPDLSSRDPLFILPIVMGVSMFIQQKLNPAPLDPMQQKVFLFLPFIFTFFFAFFPAGLVLYWLINNILSIAQQWWVLRLLETPAKKPAK
jgi:YidC/Oxa1 family membrane protein insertase